MLIILTKGTSNHEKGVKNQEGNLSIFNSKGGDYYVQFYDWVHPGNHNDGTVLVYDLCWYIGEKWECLIKIPHGDFNEK